MTGATSICDLALVDVAGAVRDRRLSATEVLDAVLARIDAVEDRVHAWASLDVDGARAAARRADQQAAAGIEPGPLHGIPVGLKDVIDTAGWPTEAGSAVLAGRVPTEDATVTARLRNAGAIILGKTVTHEFACGQDVAPTRNPWDPQRYPGGSSVGSGVAVAVGTAFGTLGTDTGGSIRNPAAVNGIVGLKPTNGLVSRHGTIPVSASLDQVGPLARTVADCALLLEVLAGHDPNDPGSADMASPQHVRLPDLHGVRVGVPTSTNQHDGIQPAVRSAVEAALDTLRGLGATVVDVDIPALDHALAIGMTIALAESATWHRPLLRHHGGDYDPGTRVMIAGGAMILGEDVHRARVARGWLRDQVRRACLTAEVDVLAGPTLPTIAAPLDEFDTDMTRQDEDGDGADLSGALRLLMMANVTGQPAISVPCGWHDDHPIGLHLVGRPFADMRLLAIADRFTHAHGLEQRRPPILA